MSKSWSGFAVFDFTSGRSEMETTRSAQFLPNIANMIVWLGPQLCNCLMGASRSYYLSYKHDDFAELCDDENQVEIDSVAFVDPANDNMPTRARLLARCRALFLGLSKRHGGSFCTDNPIIAFRPY